MRIGSREIGAGEPPYVIAEIGVNHDGEVARALELTDAAADAGADAVKLQYFETDRLMSKAAKLAAYQKAAGETDPVAMLRRLELTLDEMALVVDRAHERGIHAIVTVFSVELVKPAADLAWDAFKSASPDVVNRPLLEALAAEGKPLIVSTGASELEEVVRARGWLESIREQLAFLQCVSCYPVPYGQSGFGGLRALTQALDVPVGYSDHLLAWKEAHYPVSAGACILEKHITDDRTRHGPDHRASILSGQLRKYIESARAGVEHRDLAASVFDSEQALLSPVRAKIWASKMDFPDSEYRFVGWSIAQEEVAKTVLDCERDVREVSRQSVVTTRALAPGETIARDDLTIKRPGTGIEPWRIDEIVGRTVASETQADLPLTDDDLE